MRRLRFGGRRACAARVANLFILDFFFQTHNKLIRNFPAEVSLLSVLHQALLQENGTPGISDKNARCGQQDVAGAVMHLDPAPQETGIAGHTRFSVEAGGKGVNGTDGLPRRNLWKS